MIPWLQRHAPRLLAWWDWKVYIWSWKSRERVLTRTPGHAYLNKLWADQWHADNPPSPAVKRATECFFESMVRKGER